MFGGKKNNNNKDSEITLKEVSSKLDLSESTVKKYLKDFELEKPKGVGSKATISDSAFQALQEIAKLRENGLSIREIKELRSQKPIKPVLYEIDEELKESKKKEGTSEESLFGENVIEASLEGKSETYTENGDLTTTQDDEEKLEEDEKEQEGQEEQEEEQEEGQEWQEKEVDGARRRRLFNYRYVERQISNDSKRIGWLKQRLKNPHLSPRDRLFFEEALERRILFLDGWKHILRWVSTK